jgi:hypothetical protein
MKKLGYVVLLLALIGTGCSTSSDTRSGGARVSPNELFRAVITENTAEVVSLIEAGIDIDARTKDGATALLLASQTGHFRITQTLMEAGAELNAQNHKGFTAVMIASAQGHTGVVRMLIEAGADVNAQTDEEYTALSIATREGHTDISNLLVDAGAKLLPIIEPKFSFERALAGLWCNPEYDRYADTDMKPNLFPGKWIFGQLNNKVFAFPFDKSTDEEWSTNIPHWYEIYKQWNDDSGGIYFQLRWYWIVSLDEGYECFFLLRASPDRDYYEFALSREQFPTDIDPNNPSYHIYHRCWSESKSSDQ